MDHAPVLRRRPIRACAVHGEGQLARRNAEAAARRLLTTVLLSCQAPCRTILLTQRMRLLVLLLLLVGVTVAASASASDHWMRDASRLAVPLVIGATARAVLLHTMRARTSGPLLTASMILAALGGAAVLLYAVRARQSPPDGTAAWVAFVFVVSLAIAMTLMAVRMARDVVRSRRHRAPE